MYMIESIPAGEKMTKTALAHRPFGPGFETSDLEGAERMEIWGTAFSDPGPDYVEFRLFRNDNLAAIRKVEGF